MTGTDMAPGDCGSHYDLVQQTGLLHKTSMKTAVPGATRPQRGAHEQIQLYNLPKPHERGLAQPGVHGG